MEITTVLKKMHKRSVKNFLDVLVLSELRRKAMSGYDVMVFIYSRFCLPVSSGTVHWPIILWRDGLMKGEWHQQKRVTRSLKREKRQWGQF